MSYKFMKRNDWYVKMGPGPNIEKGTVPFRVFPLGPSPSILLRSFYLPGFDNKKRALASNLEV